MNQKFNVTSGKMVLSDPCYELDTWCQNVVENVKNGEWNASVIKNEGRRIKQLRSWCEGEITEDGLIDVIEAGDFNRSPFHIENFRDGGVDSGQFGHFDFDTYRSDESAKDLEKYDFGREFDLKDGDSWYRAVCNLTLGVESWGVLPNGVVSSSGYGDGNYETIGIKNLDGKYVGFVTTFIYDKDFEEDEWDKDEWDKDEWED